jgi:EAL domain-containing protein (putative c-di-GMP-specific phosphodiesterase class I)
VVAEGVETEAQAAKLQPWGCRIGQGFLFGEALPADLTIQRLGPTRAASSGTGDRSG